MIIVGASITSTKVKVDGSFIDGSQTFTISAVAPPNPPVNQIGKDTVLYLNPVTGELFWDYVDRPLTTIEQVNQSDERIAANKANLESMSTDLMAFQDLFFSVNPTL